MDFRRCVTEIKRALQRYRSIVNKLPKTAEFTDEEVEIRSGNVSQLLDVVSAVITLEGQLTRKVEKLHFMIKRPLQ